MQGIVPEDKHMLNCMDKRITSISWRILSCTASLSAALTLLSILLLALSPKPDLYEGLTYSTAFFDRDQRLLRLTLSHDEKYRSWTPLQDVAPPIIEATLLYEDRYFYCHCGVNPVSLARAFWQTVFKGECMVGASTLTMQVARMRFHLQTRSPSGKLRQICRALQLEYHYRKDEILEAYLNLAPYGGNIEGVGAASEIYFQKPARQLTLAESFVLCMIPQNPSQRTLKAITLPGSPAPLAHVSPLLWKRWLVKHPQDQPLTEEVMLGRVIHQPRDLPFSAPHVVNALLAERSPGSMIVTTLDLALQSMVEQCIKGYVERRTSDGIHNAAALLADCRTMEVMALAGSADFHNQEIQGQVNGTRARRSPGSTLKPFIYGLAFDQGIIHPLTMVKDAPSIFGEWRPENFDRDFAGPLPAREALIRSRNVPAITLAAHLHNPTLYEFLKNVGTARLRSPEYYGLALALGGAEMTMEELAMLYAALANSGVVKPLRYIRDAPQAVGKRILSPEASWMVLDILKDTPRPNQGYDQTWVRNPLPVSWKTGTSFSYRDAWCLGVFGPYVLGVWVGNFDGKSNPAFVGREAAAPLFFELMEAVRARSPILSPFPPSKITNLTTVDVCTASGQLPGPYCPDLTATWFIPGRSPITACGIHRAVVIDAQTGFRVCSSMNAPDTRTEVFEFWPSDLLELFRQAGIPRRSPPPWHPACSFTVRASQGLAPVITSPREGVTYTVRISNHGNATIPLSAVTDTDAPDAYWFVNNAFLGTAPSTRPFFWTAEPGEFTIRVVDALGRADSRKIKIVAVE